MRMVSSFAGPGPSGPVTPFFREEEGVKHNISCFVRDYGRLRLVPLGEGEGASRVTCACRARQRPTDAPAPNADPSGPQCRPRAALVDLLSDSVFACPGRQWARRLSQHGTSPVYRYFFTRKAVTNQGRQPAAHGMELLYVFGTMVDIPFFTPANADAELSSAMMGYWTRFAATGDPNGNDATPWPFYDGMADAYLQLDADILAQEGLHSAKCDFWDALQGQ
jgi:carboxylesterase type B